jgi:hypothetical protein
MYDVHIYQNGRWIVAMTDCKSILLARSYIPGGVHGHVWSKGVCVYDTHPGQAEPIGDGSRA